VRGLEAEPWGMSRMSPFPAFDDTAINCRLFLDPLTQTGRYVDRSGQIVEAGKHGTNRKKSTATEPPSPDSGGSKPPRPGNPDSTTDYESD
jgi:putative ATP-grasp target RiPP